MKMKFYFSNVLILFLVTFTVGCDSSPTVKVSATKLSAEELGTREHISHWLNSASKDMKGIDKFMSKAEKEKEQKNHEIANTYYNSAKKILYSWRDTIFLEKKRNTNNHRLLYPSSMSLIGDSLNELFSYGRNLSESDEISAHELNGLLIRLGKVVRADSQFVISISGRKRNPDLINSKLSLTL